MRAGWISIREAKAFVREHHRHARGLTGAIAAMGLWSEGRLVGVALIGRATSRETQQRQPDIVELLRLAVADDAPRHAASRLQSRVKRLAQVWGWTTLRTYNLASESGASLRATGATMECHLPPRSWTCTSRPRCARPVEDEAKRRWSWALPEIPA